MSCTIDDARETPGDAPLTSQWRARPLTLMPVHAVLVGVEPFYAESGEEGPKRLTRHERVPEEGHQRGR